MLLALVYVNSVIASDSPMKPLGKDAFAFDIITFPIHVKRVHWFCVMAFVQEMHIQFYSLMAHCFAAAAAEVVVVLSLEITVYQLTPALLYKEALPLLVAAWASLSWISL